MKKKKSDYALRYRLETDARGYTKDQADQIVLNEGDVGFCDAFMFTSIMRHKGGHASYLFFSEDGENSLLPLTTDEMFKLWCMLCFNLSDKKLDVWKSDLLKAVAKSIRSNVCKD